MAQRGRPPKPVERKRKTGNPGKRPLPEPVSALPTPPEPPPPPKGLQEAGRRLWRSVWEQGLDWIAPSDALAVEMLASLADERTLLRSIIDEEGRTFRTAKGYIGIHPAVSQLRAVEGEMVGLLSLLGFTPADRSRLGLAEVKRMSGLADLLQRRREDLGR